MGGITRGVNVGVWCTANRLRVAALQDTGQGSPGLLPTLGKGHPVPRQGAQLCQSCRGWGAGKRSLLTFLLNSVLIALQSSRLNQRGAHALCHSFPCVTYFSLCKLLIEVVPFKVLTAQKGEYHSIKM